MSKSIQKAEKKQHDILTAAESLFLEQGYGNSSMDEVARKSGVTKQTVYRYFPSKDKLFAAVIEKLRTVDTKPYQFSNGSINDELTGYGSFLLSFHLQPRSLGLYRLMITEGAREGLFNTFVNAGPNQVLKPLLEYLEQHCNLNDSVFCGKMFATMVLAPRNQLLMSNTANFSRSKQKEHIQKVTKLFLNIIDT